MKGPYGKKGESGGPVFFTMHSQVNSIVSKKDPHGIVKSHYFLLPSISVYCTSIWLIRGFTSTTGMRSLPEINSSSFDTLAFAQQLSMVTSYDKIKIPIDSLGVSMWSIRLTGIQKVQTVCKVAHMGLSQKHPDQDGQPK